MTTSNGSKRCSFLKKTLHFNRFDYIKIKLLNLNISLTTTLSANKPWQLYADCCIYNIKTDNFVFCEHSSDTSCNLNIKQITLNFMPAEKNFFFKFCGLQIKFRVNRLISVQFHIDMGKWFLTCREWTVLMGTFFL